MTVTDKTATAAGQNDEDAAGGHFLVSGQPLGRYVITETNAPAGYILDPTPQTVDVTPGHIAGSAANPFVNSRPILKITGFGYTNQATGAVQPDGIFRGSTTYTINLHNYGTAPAILDATSTLVVSSNATCGLSNTLNLAPLTIGIGADSAPITFTCTYDHPIPAAITATLTVNTLTNTLVRAASGSPATITFTVNPG